MIVFETSCHAGHRLTQDEGWTHYLLLGVDGETDSYKGKRSDAMIVMSVNSGEGRLVLSSVPRDTLVYIEGKGFDKLTHAYAYGGAKLTVKTFEENFDIDIQNYFTINFKAMRDMVDLIGGLELTLTDAEAKHMGDYYAAWGLSGGTQVLDGAEVLAYCRVRKIDSDYKRNDRQYRVLMAIYDEVKNDLRSCAGKTGYRFGEIRVDRLDRPRSLMDVFKSLPYKRTGVDVTI